MKHSTGYPAFVDGTIQPPGAGAISTDDQGFLSGLAVYETLLHEDRCLYFEEQHLARLADGARVLSIAWPPPWDLHAALARYAAELGARDCAVRITLTRGVPGRGPSLVIGARDLVRPPDPGVVVVLERDAKRAGDALESVKSTNRLRNVLAREAAVRAGAFEALLMNDEGDVSEGTFSNVFAAVGGAIVTPPVERGCLAGIVRGEILDELARARIAHREERLEVDALAAASEVFLSNTTGRVIPVVEVAGVRSGLPGSAGPLVRDLRERIRAREERYRSSRARRGA